MGLRRVELDAARGQPRRRVVAGRRQLVRLARRLIVDEPAGELVRAARMGERGVELRQRSGGGDRHVRGRAFTGVVGRIVARAVTGGVGCGGAAEEQRTEEEGADRGVGRAFEHGRRWSKACATVATRHLPELRTLGVTGLGSIDPGWRWTRGLGGGRRRAGRILSRSAASRRGRLRLSVSLAMRAP